MKETVYLLKSKINNNPVYKIGRTKQKVENRIKQLKTGNPESIEIVFTIDTPLASKLESVLHRIYKDCREDGEWFSLSESTVEKIPVEAIKLDDNLRAVYNNDIVC